MDKSSKEILDTWTKKIVSWHFSPETGTPFWLNRQQALGWNPLEEISSFSDLVKFGHFNDEWLRTVPVRDWIPKAHAGKPVYVFETGGSTGAPKSRINIEDFRIDYSEFSTGLEDASFPPGSDWLMLGPSGPRRLRLAIEHLAQIRGGICFHVDMDPRWVIKLTKKQDLTALQDYVEHVVEQGLSLLKSHPTIRCVFTTPKLLEALCEKISLKKQGIKGVFCGGTQMTAQYHRFAVEELLEGAAFVPVYGNTLMGLAVPKPFDPADKYKITYYPPLPRAFLQVVDLIDEKTVVPSGESGRVLLTTLTKEFFLQNYLERDEAVRVKGCPAYPWDGVGEVTPLSGLQSTVVEGVY